MNWKLKTFVLPLCTAALTTLVAETGANATIINETEAFDITGTDTDTGAPVDGTATLQFDLFNGALGTLNSVAVSIASNIEFSLRISGSEGGDANSTHGAEVTSTELGAAATSIFSEPLNNSSGGDFTVLGPSTPINDDLFVLLGLAPPVLANFTGVGTFDIELSDSANIDSCVAAGSFDPLTCDATTDWVGEITVSYDFTPSGQPGGEVPEPATLGLFGFGVVGMGYLARRRRKTGVNA